MDVRRVSPYLARRWGWVVTAASFWLHFVCFGICYCFNITFIALQEEFGTTSTATSWVGSTPIGLFTLSGLFVMPLVYRFNDRAVALVGIVLCFTSCMVTSLITVFPVIYLTYSVLYGIGGGCASLASFNLILQYFPDVHSARATLFTTMGSSTGMLCLGPLTYALIERWGWRIMLRIMSSILLVVGIMAVTVFYPPSSPHRDPPERYETETKQRMLGDPNVRSPTDGIREKSEGSDNHTNVQVETKKEVVHEEPMNDNNNVGDNDANKTVRSEEIPVESKPFLRDSISATSEDEKNTNGRAVAIATDESALADGTVLETRIKAESPMSFWVKHRPIFYPEVWVLGFCIMGVGVMNSFFYINMGDFLLSVGFEYYVVPWVVTTLGISEVAGKLVLGVIADRLPFPKIFLYVNGSCTGIGCMICLLVVRSVILLMFLAVVIGLVVMTIGDALSYSICNQVFRNEDAVHTWTVVMFLQGVGFMLGAVFGESIDKTGSYNEAIYTSIGMYVVCSLLCIAVPLYQKFFAPERMVMFSNQIECRRSKMATSKTTKATRTQEMAATEEETEICPA